MTIPELKHYANIYSMTEQGAWLNEIDWNSKPLFLKDGPKMGSRWFGDIILVDPISKDMTDSMQFNTYIHELRHIWQTKKQGWIKYAIRNLFRRNEPDAVEAGLTAQEWYGDEKCREMQE
jgi:hypothetical protein